MESGEYFYGNYKMLDGTKLGEVRDRLRRAVTLAAHLLEGGKDNG